MTPRSGIEQLRSTAVDADLNISATWPRTDTVMICFGLDRHLQFSYKRSDADATANINCPHQLLIEPPRATSSTGSTAEGNSFWSSNRDTRPTYFSFDDRDGRRGFASGSTGCR